MLSSYLRERRGGEGGRRGVSSCTWGARDFAKRGAAIALNHPATKKTFPFHSGGDANYRLHYFCFRHAGAVRHCLHGEDKAGQLFW